MGDGKIGKVEVDDELWSKMDSGGNHEAALTEAALERLRQQRGSGDVDCEQVSSYRMFQESISEICRTLRLRAGAGKSVTVKVKINYTVPEPSGSGESAAS